MFGYGTTGTETAVSNLVSNTGVVATDRTGVGSARSNLAAARYGSDKAIFWLGTTSGAQSGRTLITNLVSNTGVIASDTTNSSLARYRLAAAGYGTDKAIFGFGTTNSSGPNSNIDLISNTGVVVSSTSGVGTARWYVAAASYGGDKAMFGYGTPDGTTNVSVINLVSNTGVVATDTTGVGTARQGLAAAGYSLT
jgi:hypothetical protein